MEAGATAVAVANGFDPDADTISVVSPTTLDTDETNSVEVELTRIVPRYFTALFGDDPINIRARASAAYSSAANACVLSLDKSAGEAVKFTGNSGATLAGCIIMANSLASNAIVTDGNASVTAPCLMAVGGIITSDNSHISLTECQTVMTGQPPAADPFRDVPYPTASGCTTHGGGGLAPGCYNGGVALKGAVNLASGVYIINGGALTINANATVIGSDVTFVLLNGATVDLNGNATIQLDAPTTGTYKGMLFMGSRTSSIGGISKFNGNANSRLTGAIYFPKQNVDYRGNFSGNGGCTQIVAATVTWGGNTSFNVDCSTYGMEPIMAGSPVRLIG
jgi:hypothetical protein